MDKILEKIREYGVIPLVTLDDPQDAYVLGRALTDCSLPIVEITFRSGAAEEAIRILRSTYPDMLVGAGTVLDADMAERAIKAGAQFVLAPGMNPGMIEYCLAEEIPVFPGCMTPTDLGQAQNLGLKVVKIFPFMQLGGIPMLKAISAPFGKMEFLATGGINDENLASSLAFPRMAACGGSWLIKKEKLRKGDLEGLKSDINRTLTAMLGLRFAHLGINYGMEAAKTLEQILNVQTLWGQTSGFTGDYVEAVKTAGQGKNGHIAVGTCDIGRAIFYLQRKGFGIQTESVKKNEAGHILAAYLKEDAGGFAVHLLQETLN